VELVDQLNTPAEIESSVSFTEKPRANLPPPTMRTIYKSSTSYDEALDMKKLHGLAQIQKQGRVAACRNKKKNLPRRRRGCRESPSQEIPTKHLVSDDDGWETREFTSRDAETSLTTPVFFASIDQRDDSAGGESACAVLVAVLAAALHASHPEMPTRPELDALFRDGSSEWRRLCGDEAHMQRFPDRHFDLDTVLAARTTPIAVLHDRGYVGFFHPESFASLSGAMSFDDIWREISSTASRAAPGHADVYIVAWNDHFFVLKAERDCYYVVDTLGERLFEGCRKAYMLRFDATSEMRSVSSPSEVIVTASPGRTAAGSSSRGSWLPSRSGRSCTSRRATLWARRTGGCR
jgi:hypothetical protein